MDPGLRPLSLFCGRLIQRRVVGRVAHVLGEGDERPAHMQVVDGAAIVPGVDDGHGGAREAREVLAAARFGERLVVLEEGLERHRVRSLPAPDHLHHGGIDAAVHGQEEMFRLQEACDQTDGLVVDEKRPEKRLFGLQVVRQRAVFFGLLGGATIAHSATYGWAPGGASSAMCFRAMSA